MQDLFRLKARKLHDKIHNILLRALSCTLASAGQGTLFASVACRKRGRSIEYNLFSSEELEKVSRHPKVTELKDDRILLSFHKSLPGLRRTSTVRHFLVLKAV